MLDPREAARAMAAQIKNIRQNEQELLTLTAEVEPKMTKAQKEKFRVAKERRNGR